MLDNLAYSIEHEVEEIRVESEFQPAATELEDLRHERELFRAVIDNFPGGIALFDKNLRMVLCNNVLKRLLQYPESLFEFGQPSLEQIFRFNALRGEYGPGEVEEHVAAKMNLVNLRCAHVYERARPNGTVLEVRGMPLESGGFVTTYVDITNQRASHAEGLQHHNSDKLTKLPKRDTFEKHLWNTLQKMRPGDVNCVHCLDLDGFAELNRIHGKVTCDFILKEIALRLGATVRGMDFLARGGGDRFLVLQSPIVRPSDVAKLANRMLEAVKKPIICGGTEIQVSTSIGFALAPRDGNDVATILSKAEVSVLSTKKRNPGGFDNTVVGWQ